MNSPDTLYWFEINELAVSPAPDTISLKIRLNEKHPIFKGHFPSMPVLPGVCILDILEECTSSILKLKSKFISIDYIKFLKPVIPGSKSTYTLLIKLDEKVASDNEITAQLSLENEIFIKLKGVLSSSE